MPAATPKARSRLLPEIDLDRSGKQTGFLRLPHSVHRSAYGWIPIPIAQISNKGANGSGPTVLLMAGNHGDEYEGQAGLGRLIRELDPGEVQGRIISLPSANFPAAMAGSRTSPLDQGNLNRSFPGDSTGGPTAQIAYYIEHELLPRCDFVLDIHSGGSSLTYLPSTLGRRPDTPEGVERAIELMRVFGAPIGYLVDGGGWGDMTLTAAAHRAGVRHMSTELAGGGQVTPAALRIAEGGGAPGPACARGADALAASGGIHDPADAGQRPGLLLLRAGAGPVRAARRARRRDRGRRGGGRHPSARHAVARARDRPLRASRHGHLQARPRPRRTRRLPLPPRHRPGAVT